MHAGISVTYFDTVTVVVKNDTVNHFSIVDITQLSDILCVLKPLEKKWHALGIHLQIKKEALNRIESDYKHESAQRHLTEMVDYWQKNENEPSWDKLANAVDKVGGYDYVARTIKFCEVSDGPVSLDLQKSAECAVDNPLKVGEHVQLRRYDRESGYESDSQSQSNLLPGCGDIPKMCAVAIDLPILKIKVQFLTINAICLP